MGINLVCICDCSFNRIEMFFIPKVPKQHENIQKVKAVGMDTVNQPSGSMLLSSILKFKKSPDFARFTLLICLYGINKAIFLGRYDYVCGIF